MELDNIIIQYLPLIQSIRENLYNLAEPSFAEYKTHDYIASILKGNGISFFTIGETGICGLINEDKDCLAIRADMDAILVDGKMVHACGHDFHMAIVLGCGIILNRMGIDKCVKLIFQPGEEGSGGAKKLIEQGILNQPKVKALIGLHVWPYVDVGSIEVSSGAIMASVDDFTLTFTGIGGHAAMPEKTKNPIYPAIQTISTVNNIMASQFNKIKPAHVSFSSIQAGELPNVIPDKCIIKGTVRTFDKQTQDQIYNIIIDTAKQMATCYSCKVEIDYNYQYPPLYNHQIITKKFIEATTKLGDIKISNAEKSLTAEDFSFYANLVPSVYFRLGIKENDFGVSPLHSKDFSASPKCIFYGLKTIINFILSTDINSI